MHLLAVSTVLYFCSGLMAQAQAPEARPAARERLVVTGSVRDADGKPWTEARVTLLSLAYLDDERVGEVDRIVVQTDGGGEFRARILPGRTYDAWAVGPVEDGVYRATDIATRRLAGAAIRLRQAPEKRQQLRVQFLGLEHWQSRGPLRAYASSSARDHYHRVRVELRLDAEGFSTLPPLPGTTCRVDLEDASGLPITTRSFVLAHDRRAEVHTHETKIWEGLPDGPEKDAAKPLAQDIERVDLPRRSRILVRFESEETKEPAVGVTVAQRVGDTVAELGETDEDGYLEVPFAVANEPAPSPTYQALHLIAYGPDHSETERTVWLRFVEARDAKQVVSAEQVYLDIPRGRDVAALRERGQSDLDVPLGEGRTVRGRVLLSGNRVLPRAPILFVDTGRVHVRKLTTNSDGEFTISGCRPNVEFRLLTVLREDQIVTLPESKSKSMNPVVWLHAGKTSEAPELELEDIALEDLSVFEVATDSRTPERERRDIVRADETRTNLPDDRDDVRRRIHVLIPKLESDPGKLIRTSTETKRAPLAPLLLQGGGTGIEYEDIVFPNTSGVGSRFLPTRVYYPRGFEAINARTFPVVVFIHGYSKIGREYPGIGEHFAAHGYFAFMIDTARWDVVLMGHDGRAMFSILQNENARRDSPFAGKLDMTRVGVIGHSWGGANVNCVLADNPGYVLGAGFAPHAIPPQFAKSVRVPIAIVVGKGDKITPFTEHALSNFQANTRATDFKVMHVLDESCHHGNVASYTYLGAEAKDRAIFEHCIRVIRSFCDCYLKDDHDALAAVVGPASHYRELVETQIELATPKFFKSGSEKLGETVYLHLLGEAGLAAHLFSYGTAKIPMNFGTLLLDPHYLMITNATVLERAGVATQELSLPEDEAFRGLELFFQGLAFADGKPRFSGLVSIKIGHDTTRR
ncbi:MAG: hypothetical protein H6833_03930 [Planctomycetes bacterium]|nr:hypothetical protein [Planctomycetota bacterium]